jgi:hypothetical protein
MKISKRVMQTLMLMLLVFVNETRAHDVAASNLWLDIGTYAVDAEIHLPLYELREAIGLPADVTAAQLAIEFAPKVSAYISQHIDLSAPNHQLYSKRVISLAANHSNNNDWIIVQINFQSPSDIATNKFTLSDDVIVANIITHNILVFVRRDFRNAVFSNISSESDATDAKPVMLGVMHYQQKQLIVDGSNGSWLQGFSKVFQLGMQHIAEGTDHLLFLLVLLLAAPLSMRNKRWSGFTGVRMSVWKVLKTVSGFTLGHSLTLIMGALGILKFSSEIIEVLIALSILVSAVHAIRPLFANREHYIAALFGLVHGLAFANSISGFNYDSVALCVAVLGFNLGIETMQLVIVLAVLPSLLVMRTTAFYRYFRMGVALATGLLAVAWALERAFNFTNPLTFMSDLLIAHGVLAVAILAFMAITAYAVESFAHAFIQRRRFRLNLMDPFNS